MTLEASPPAGEATATHERIRVLFVCTGNSARSQAAAFDRVPAEVSARIHRFITIPEAQAAR